MDISALPKTLLSSIEYAYDKDGYLCKKTVTTGENVAVYKTEYPENASPVTRVTVNGKAVGVSHSKTDSFGRKVFDEIQTGSGFISRQFSYHAGQVTDEHKQNGKLKSSPTTSLVSQITLSDGRAISYEYDAEERITRVTDSIDGITEYTYDALGQLLTETVNDTVVNQMTYDNYGNILTKNGVTYTYDTVWKDKLLAVGNDEISYDAQGNPTSYLGHTLTWEKGRQLSTFDSNTYTYNAMGVRTSKTVGTVRHTFMLDGAKIVKETWGNNTLTPFYNNEDSVCGIIFNGTAYYFLKNLQGDIIAITNAEGETVARYTYDAWGKCTITQDTTVAGIATVNPFRYRGYYLDTETGLYYLNSRYYDPETARFLNSDSPVYVSITGGNLYSYCENSPTGNADYMGFCATPVVQGGINKNSKNKIKEIYDALLPNIYFSRGVEEVTMLDLYFFKIGIVGGGDFQTNGSGIIGFLLSDDEIETTVSIPIDGFYSLGLSTGMKGVFNTFTIALYTSSEQAYSSIGIKFYFSPMRFAYASVFAIAYAGIQLQYAWMQIKQAFAKVLPYAALAIIIVALIYLCPYFALAFA